MPPDGVNWTPYFTPGSSGGLVDNFLPPLNGFFQIDNYSIVQVNASSSIIKVGDASDGFVIPTGSTDAISLADLAALTMQSAAINPFVLTTSDNQPLLTSSGVPLFIN